MQDNFSGMAASTPFEVVPLWYIIFYTLIITTVSLVQALTWTVPMAIPVLVFPFLQFNLIISSTQLVYQIPLLVPTFE